MYYGVITGNAYSDAEVKRNALPECVMEVNHLLTSKEEKDHLLEAERYERNCYSCRACASAHYI
ncbi:MAG: hypothetical protein J6Y02_01030 [Pseudobutyrivibrio sp.]|nr:hypothetical protein [Pseudobutyrivibrio sp.]